MICYDITNAGSFQSIRKWMDDIENVSRMSVDVSPTHFACYICVEYKTKYPIVRMLLN